MQVRWSVKAIEQRERILRHIAKDNLEAALRLDSRIEREAAALAQFPFLGRQSRRANFRVLVIGNTEYLIAYRVAKDVVNVSVVFHGKRDISHSY